MGGEVGKVVVGSGGFAVFIGSGCCGFCVGFRFDGGTLHGSLLETAQALYEKKLTTYPRTDCRYLPSEQFGDAERILGALAAVPGLEEAAKGADAARRSAAWDTGKVR